jgi:hypothetical protein
MKRWLMMFLILAVTWLSAAPAGAFHRYPPRYRYGSYGVWVRTHAHGYPAYRYTYRGYSAGFPPPAFLYYGYPLSGHSYGIGF